MYHSSLRDQTFHTWLPVTQLISATHCHLQLRLQWSPHANDFHKPVQIGISPLRSRSRSTIVCQKYLTDANYSRILTWECPTRAYSFPASHCSAPSPPTLSVIKHTTNRPPPPARKCRNLLCFSVHVHIIELGWDHHKSLRSVPVLWFRIFISGPEQWRGLVTGLCLISSPLTLLESYSTLSKMQTWSTVSPATKNRQKDPNCLPDKTQIS